MDMFIIPISDGYIITYIYMLKYGRMWLVLSTYKWNCQVPPPIRDPDKNGSEIRCFFRGIA